MESFVLVCISRLTSSSRPRKAASVSAAYGTKRAWVALESAFDSSTSDAPARSSPAKTRGPRTCAERERKHGECADVAGNFDLARGQCVPALMVPDQASHRAGEPPPADVFFCGDLLVTESPQRSLHHRRSDGRSVGDQQRQSAQEQ